jgi:hypothetical protein
VSEAIEELRCEKHPDYSCRQFTSTVDPADWCHACLVNEVRRLVEVERAAESFVLAKRGWERWGGGHFLYDRLDGFGNGSVYSLVDALERFAAETRRRRERAT